MWTCLRMYWCGFSNAVFLGWGAQNPSLLQDMICLRHLTRSCYLWACFPVMCHWKEVRFFSLWRPKFHGLSKRITCSSLHVEPDCPCVNESGDFLRESLRVRWVSVRFFDWLTRSFTIWVSGNCNFYPSSGSGKSVWTETVQQPPRVFFSPQPQLKILIEIYVSNKGH